MDEDLFEELNQHFWCLHAEMYAGRIAYDNGMKRPILMHRFIIGAAPDVEVDHRNEDKLDNRRSNLREATHSGNAINRSATRAKSGYRGVSRDKKTWAASIQVERKTLYLGSFKRPEAAAVAYDAAARRHHGEFARLNFPKPGELAAARTGSSP